MFTLINIQRNVPVVGETLLTFGVGTPVGDGEIDGKLTYLELRNVLLRSSDHTVGETDLELEAKARVVLNKE